jgi:hypothetical protein
MDEQINKPNPREEAIKKAQQKTIAKRIAYVGIPLIILGLLGWWWMRSIQPAGEDKSVEYANQGQIHIKENESHPPYNSNPPTSGWHYLNPARLGFYDEELPDETLIHNLEHGEIWISFKPTTPEEMKTKLKSVLGTRVIITKRAKNDTDIVIAAWTRLDAFNLENGVLTDDQIGRLEDFIKRWQNRGPEKVVSQPF